MIEPVSLHFLQFVDGPQKNLTRRANQGHINIIAKIHKARTEKSAAGFLLEFSSRACRSVGPAQNILKLST
jgi:hypothetical protein